MFSEKRLTATKQFGQKVKDTLKLSDVDSFHARKSLYQSPVTS